MKPYGETGDHLALPVNVLLEKARNGITKFVHFSNKNPYKNVGQADMESGHPASIHSSLNSRIISGSFGHGRIRFSSLTVWKLDGVGPVDNRPSTD